MVRSVGASRLRAAARGVLLVSLLALHPALPGALQAAPLSASPAPATAPGAASGGPAGSDGPRSLAGFLGASAGPARKLATEPTEVLLGIAALGTLAGLGWLQRRRR